MTSMSVLYLRTVGQPLGALSTTIPGDPPALGQAPTLRVTVPVVTIPRSIIVLRDDLAIAMLEAEFDDPLNVFQWRVVTTQGADGTVKHHLDRIGSGTVTLTSPSSKVAQLVVPRLGNEPRLRFEIRNEKGFSRSEVLIFGSNPTETVQVNLPEAGDYVFFVEGYPPAAVNVTP